MLSRGRGVTMSILDLASATRGRVLVLDDDPVLRETVAGILEGAVAVKAVGSIPAAWTALATDTYDVLISDHPLVDGSGVELLRQVADRYPQVSRILLTGEVDEPQVRQLAAEARDEGHTLVLWKPVAPADLLSWVGNGVAMARLARARARFRAGA